MAETKRLGLEQLVIRPQDRVRLVQGAGRLAGRDVMAQQHITSAHVRQMDRLEIRRRKTHVHQAAVHDDQVFPAVPVHVARHRGGKAAVADQIVYPRSCPRRDHTIDQIIAIRGVLPQRGDPRQLRRGLGPCPGQAGTGVDLADRRRTAVGRIAVGQPRQIRGRVAVKLQHEQRLARGCAGQVDTSGCLVAAIDQVVPAVDDADGVPLIEHQIVDPIAVQIAHAGRRSPIRVLAEHQVRAGGHVHPACQVDGAEQQVGSLRPAHQEISEAIAVDVANRRRLRQLLARHGARQDRGGGEIIPGGRLRRVGRRNGGRGQFVSV